MKIAIYYNHLETLGHTTRVFTIVQALKQQYPESDILILQGGKNQDFYWGNKFNVINLPDPLFDKKWFNKEDPAQKQITRQWKSPAYNIKHTKKRTKFMLEQLKEFNPDIFITEFFPFGRHIEQFEMIPILEILKKQGTKIISCVGYPILPDTKKLLAFAPYFDKILIHTPEHLDLNYIYKFLEDRPNELQHYKETFARLPQIEFTGYNIPQTNKKSKQQIRTELNVTNEKLVMISRGGGAIYDNIILQGILAKKYLPEGIFFVIITGPATSEKEQVLFEKLASKISNKIKVIHYTEDFLNYLNAADIHISMTGYNTSIQNLYFKKRTILIPKADKESDGEQFYRANMLKELLNASIIEIHNLKAQPLAQEILKKLNEPEPHPNTDNYFNGAQHTAQFIGGLLNECHL